MATENYWSQPSYEGSPNLYQSLQKTRGAPVGGAPEAARRRVILTLPCQWVSSKCRKNFLTLLKEGQREGKSFVLMSEQPSAQLSFF